MKHNRNYWLFIILLVAFLLRFFLLDKIPISLNWDEVTFAYNAYSILETGKDEYGRSFPLIFESIGDYKNPLMVYIMVPFVKIFGLNELAIRIPSSIFSIFTVFLVFILVRILFKNIVIAVLAAFSITISPWHLQFSRAGLEPPISMFLITLGVYSFIKAIKSDNKFFILSSVSFGLAFYSYYADRFFVPLILITLVIIFKKEIWIKKRYFLLWIALMILFLAPLLIPFISSGSQYKISNTTLLGYRPSDLELENLKSETSVIYYNLFHNDFVRTSFMIANRYLNHFSPSFLFIKGPDDNRQLIYGMGMMYIFELPLLILGLIRLLKLRTKESLFVLSWLLLAPLPAAITRDEVHARRAFEMVVPVSVVLAFGYKVVIDNFHKILMKIFLIFGVPMALYSILFYLISYYIITPFKTFEGSAGWQYGYKQLVERISSIKNNYNYVIVDTSYQGPYVYFLFYEKYPPKKYQPQAKLQFTCETCLGEGIGYDNYQFRVIYWPNDKSIKKSLFAGPPERIPEKDIEEGKSKILDKIYFPDGRIAFIIAETF